MTASAITKNIAAWVSGLHHNDIPDDVRRAIRFHILDTFGVGISGTEQPWTKIVTEWAMRGALSTEQTGLASPWGKSRPQLRPGDAALINGTAAHAFELDDFHNAKVHPGSVVIPAAMAVAEAVGATGPALETAIVAGYEVMIRTALALNPSHARLRGWHLTPICGTFGAAAAASSLLRLNAEQTAWALGLAGTQSGGLFAFNVDGSMSKRFHPGRAAQSGVLAAELALLGLSGPTSIYEAEDGGFLKTFSDVADPTHLLTGLGTTWRAAETNSKPYACCGSIHSHIDAALSLRAAYRRDALVRAGVPTLVDIQCGYPYQPSTALNAQMSLRYCLAVALLDGAVLPEQFTPERITDPILTSISQSIEVVRDPALDALYPRHFVGWVEIEDTQGQFRRVERLDPSGSPASPNFETALRAKFHVLADPVLGKTAAHLLEAAVSHFDNATAPGLIKFLAEPASRRAA